MTTNTTNFVEPEISGVVWILSKNTEKSRDRTGLNGAGEECQVKETNTHALKGKKEQTAKREEFLPERGLIWVTEARRLGQKRKLLIYG